MVEPPNALTLMLFEEATPSGMYQLLASKRCLSESALRDRAKVMLTIDTAIADFHSLHSRGPIAGGSLQYTVILALAHEGFLNQYARARIMADRTSQGFSARLRASFQEVWWRLRY
jgi:hypothetical protein